MDYPAQDDIGVTFVNLVLGSGSYNGVINLNLGVVNFDPDEKEKTGGISYKPTTAVRLRMDPECAKNIYHALARFVEVDPLKDKPVSAPAVPTVESGVSGKPH